MLLYGLTIFLSAFLLFQVQPMIAKIILPWFGGGAAVWSTCLMFFQLALLAGYFYSHLVIRYVPVRAQAVLHSALLLAAALIPIHPGAQWKPMDEHAPLVKIVLLLGGTVGLSYLMLATTGPLLQAWYTRSTGGAAPYRLYALSNAGSFLALLTFPFVFEPMLSSSQQTAIWRGGFLVFAGLALLVAWRMVPKMAAAGSLHASPDQEAASPGWKTLALWILFATCPSILLSAISSHLTQNVAPMPFLWVLPLSIYLLTFVLCFDSERFYHRGLFLLLLIVALGSGAFLLTEEHWDGFWPTYVWSGILFVCCMLCHGELAARKPHPANLTIFFLMLSIGGALGGLFVGLISPLVFNHYWELPIGLLLCAVLAIAAIGKESLEFFPHSATTIGSVAFFGTTATIVVTLIKATDPIDKRYPYLGAVVLLMLAGAVLLWRESQPEYLGRRYSRYFFAMVAIASHIDYLTSGKKVDWEYYTPLLLYAGAAMVFTWELGVEGEVRLGAPALGFLALLLGGHLIYNQLDNVRNYVFAARNFYGVLKVREYAEAEDTTANRTLIHGSINHGMQLTDPQFRREPTSYYTPTSGFGRALRVLQRKTSVRVGVTGLGAGVTAAFCRPGDYFRFYELNPLVLQIAKSQFTFLNDCPADKDVYLGDGRLVMERQSSQQFDLIAMDAFSSDSVPVHLLTREAFDLFNKHLRPGGVLTINVSNRYLDLIPVVTRNARDTGMTAVLVIDDENERDYYASTSWVVCSRDKDFFADPLFIGNVKIKFPTVNPALRPWTDAYSNLFQILKKKEPRQ